MLRGAADVPYANPTRGPGLEIGRGLKKMTLVPGGARGVRLKSKIPLSWASADKRGLMRDGRSKLRVSVAWGRS